MSNQRRGRPASAAQTKRPLMASVIFSISITGPLVGLLLLAQIPLFLPMVSLIAFASSAIVALGAWCSSSDRHGTDITLWDISGALAFIGAAAGMLSEPQQVLDF
jgi:hypothetical protein